MQLTKPLGMPGLGTLILALGALLGVVPEVPGSPSLVAGRPLDIEWLRAELLGTGGGTAPTSYGAGLAFDLNAISPIVLAPNTSGQTVDLFVHNGGPSLEVGGLDLKIGITGGGSPAPTFTGIDLRSGSTFTTGNSVQSGDPANSGQLQFWSVSINDPFSPPSVAGAGSSTKVGTLTFSTIGVGNGQWALTLFSPETSFIDPFGDTLMLTLASGTLEIGAGVPEPLLTSLLAGVGLLGWVAIFPRQKRGGLPASGRSSSRGNV